ncbi:MAG TPA: glycerol-3-phosphate acyltransferase, partial [Anaerolineales bacterium]|nr:glycerol-3-phosphate acyltransferase [Anaerolineales bacterium]
SRLITRLLAPGLDLEKVRLPNPDGSEGEPLLTVGATTAAMKLGPRVGCAIGLLDILKAFVPVLAIRLLCPDQYYFLVAGLFAVVGHNWPVYYRFRGGGGMSPTLGGFLAVDWLGTLVANVIGMLFGFAVIRDVFFAYVGWTWFMIPWLWIRTRNPVFVIYALAVNLIFFLALLPEIRRYLEVRKSGVIDMQQGMEVTPMGRGMLKMARKMGFFKEKGGSL